MRDDLAELIHGEVIEDPGILAPYAQDASLFKVSPKLVVRPKDIVDIQNLVRYVNRHHHQALSLTARAAGTDMSGGPLTRSIVVDMQAHFNRLHKVGRGFAVTEPGVFYRDFERETLKTGQLMPAYPASRELCTVGGMAANNSGGEKTLRYGKTENYVESLSVVLADGEPYVLRPLSAKDLNVKLKARDFEGAVYRQMVNLIKPNSDILAEAKPKVSKNSAGYNLWDVWDQQSQIFDLTKLFVGSQGTLGLITEIRYRLIKPHKHSRLLVIFLKNLDHLAEIINAILPLKPESFESYDDHTLKLAIRFMPDILRQIKGQTLVSLLWQFLPEASFVAIHGIPKLVLLAEFTSDTPNDAQRQALTAKQALADFPIKTLVTKNRLDARKYWVIRRESFNLLRHHLRGMHTAPFIDDVVVKPSQLGQFLPELNAIMGEYDLIYTIAGHVGDANFHIIPIMNMGDPKNRAIIPELSRRVYDLVIKYHGSITGEHNDGLIRSPFLRQMYGEKIYRLFQQTKKIFDPNNIFNPGKKVNARLDDALDHLVKE